MKYFHCGLKSSKINSTDHRTNPHIASIATDYHEHLTTLWENEVQTQALSPELNESTTPSTITQMKSNSIKEDSPSLVVPLHLHPGFSLPSNGTKNPAVQPAPRIKRSTVAAESSGAVTAADLVETVEASGRFLVMFRRHPGKGGKL